MNYIKKHKLTVFIILVYIIMVCFAFFIYNMFIGSSGLPVYGDRLDGINDVMISDKQFNDIKDELLKENFVVNVTKPYLNGKILKVIIYVADQAEIDPSKKLTDKITQVLTEEQNKYFDIEVYVTKYYNCELVTSGKTDEDGIFTESITVKFNDDLSKTDAVLEYGISKDSTVNYNKEQDIRIEEDGEYIIYGYTKDKLGESTCSIKVVKKASDVETTTTEISSLSSPNFPIIGYRKAGTSNFIWTKNR